MNRTFTLSLIDPKPFGAFIEYTLKPILEEMREILELSNRDTRSLRRVFYVSVCLFVFDKFVSSLTTLAVTGAICWTILRILSNFPLINQ